MKKILAIIGVSFATFACTPTLEPEIPGSSQEEEILVQSVELNTTSLSLQPGEKASLNGTVRPDNATIGTIVK